MQSHSYDYTGRQFLGMIMPPLVVFLGCVATLHLVDWAGWPPFRAGNPQIQHQAKAAHSRNPAQIVFVGDSTCWCGIDPTELSNELPGHAPAVNLSLIIWYDLGRYAQQTADFAKANPKQIKWVVLLVNIYKLTGEAEPPDQTKLWRLWVGDDCHHSFLGQDDFFTGSLLGERWAQLILPKPLQNRWASFFGFMNDRIQFMTAHNGGAFDIGDYVPRGNVQYFVDWHTSAKFEPACRDFRKKMAPGVKLAIGLTPVPLGTTPPESRKLYLACLQQWNEWMQADLVLSNLPVALPTSCFAPGGHMNVIGQKVFTSVVAKELSPVMR